MCAYCMIGDSFSRWDPPFADWQTKSPLIPAPIPQITPISPWPIEKLREYLNLLKEVKELEDKLGCPCEPNKADYIRLLEDRITDLKKQLPA